MKLIKINKTNERIKRITKIFKDQLEVKLLLQFVNGYPVNSNVIWTTKELDKI